MPPKTQAKKFVKKSYARKSKKSPMTDTKSLINLIKTVNLNQAEHKYKTSSGTLVNMKHDTLYSYQLWDYLGTLSGFLPQQGVSDDERIGDRIMVQGFRLRMVLQVPWDRRNMNVKLWFIPYNTGQGNPTTYSDLFHNVSGNSQLDPIQIKRWPGVIFLGNYSLKPKDRDISAQQTDATIYINKWVKMEKSVYFKTDSGNIPSNLKEYGKIVFAPYDTINTLLTDNVITKAEITATLYFKDL